MMSVQGSATESVAYAVAEEAGYTGSDKVVSGEATGHVLNWWHYEMLPVSASRSKWNRDCRRYVRGRMKGSRPSFFANPVKFVFWPFIISTVIRLIIDWLLSSNSRSWRMKNR